MWWWLASCSLFAPQAPEASQPEAPPEAPRSKRPAGSADRDFLHRMDIDAAKHPDAVCNDGSVPVLYHRPGTGDGADKWVVWLQGGGNCYEEDACEARDANQVSSKPWRRKDTLGPKPDADGPASGILDPRPKQNPDFHDWNHAFLVYCTSDTWSGTRAASKQTWGLHFQGSRVLDAMIDALSDEERVGEHPLDDAGVVVLAGSSAGAIGLRNNLDRLAKDLAPARVVGISDAALTGPPPADQEEAGLKVASAKMAWWKARLDESCVADEDEPARCMAGATLISGKHLKTPMFVHQDQLDPASIGDLDPKDRAALSGQAERLRDLCEDQEAVFLPAARQHVALTTSRFWETRIEGVSLAEAVGNWVLERKGPTHLVVQEPGTGGGPTGRPSKGRKSKR